MFYRAQSFNSAISRWDVRNVTKFDRMFNGSSSFSQNLCEWGSRVEVGTLSDKIFHQSGCQSWIDPNLTSIPPGPFCVDCKIDSFVSKIDNADVVETVDESAESENCTVLKIDDA